MRIGIANDLPMALRAISMVLEESGKHHVVWTAENGKRAVECCTRDTPDLVIMDLVMPIMDGTKATRAIMKQCPTAILVVTASVNQNRAMAFRAMGDGALDVITTPSLGNTEGISAFLAKIDQLEVLLNHKSRSALKNREREKKQPRAPLKNHDLLIAIGCSAGGPAALSQILSRLPRDPKAAIVIIQHIDQNFSKGLADWLRTQTSCPLRLAALGEAPTQGTILVSDSIGHLELLPSGKLDYNKTFSTPYSPSINVFFSSVAKHWRGQCMGIILTGMGNDGASGLLEMRNRGFLTIAQSEDSSAIFGMPKAAIRCNAASKILPLRKIAEQIEKWTSSGVFL